MCTTQVGRFPITISIRRAVCTLFSKGTHRPQGESPYLAPRVRIPLRIRPALWTSTSRLKETFLRTPCYELVVVLLFTLIGALSIRGLLATGNLGHTWDWAIPFSPVGLSKMYEQGVSMWNPQFLGSSFTFTASVTPVWIILGYLGTLGIGGQVISKALVIFSISAAGSSMFFFSRSALQATRIGSRFALEIPALITGYFYATNPFFFNSIVAGAVTQIATYAVAPMVFFCFDKSLRSKSLTWMFLSALSLTVISAAFNMLFLIVILIPLFGVLLYGRRGFVGTLKLAFFWFPLNAFWLIPFFWNLSYVVSFVQTVAPASNGIDAIAHNTSGPLQSLLVAGYWRSGMNANGLLFPNFFVNSIPTSQTGLWLLLATLGFCIALIPLFGRPQKRYIFWLAIFLGTIVFDTGIYSPIPQLVKFAYQHFWFMALFSSPQWLIWPSAFSLSILLGHGFRYASFRLQRDDLRRKISKRFLLLPLLFLLISVWTYPTLLGNLGGMVDNYNLPPGYDQAMQYVSSHSLPGERMIFLPMAYSPLYLPTPFQGSDQGGNPDLYFASRPTLTTDNSLLPTQAKLAGRIMELFNSSKASDIAPALAFLDVRFVLLLTSVVPNSGVDAARWNYRTVYDSLGNATSIKLILQNNYMSLWENTKGTNNDLYLSTRPIIEPSLPVILSGSWESKNGSIQGVQGKLLLTNQTQNDFAVTARISLANNQSYDASLIFGYDNDSNYYYTGLFGRSYLITQGQYSLGVRQDRDSQPGFVSPLYVHVLVHDRNLLVSYSYNGTTWQLAGNSSLPNYHGGYVGLSSSQSADFSDIHLLNQNGVDLFNQTSPLTLLDMVSNPSFLEGSSVLLSPNFREQLLKIGDLSPTQLPDATINRVDSTSYTVQVRNVTNYVIVLNQGYDENWVLYDGTVSWYQAPFTPPSSHCSHIPANIFGNAWVCNTSGRHDYTLYYRPQSHFVIGLTISIIFGAIFAVFLLVRSMPLAMRIAEKRKPAGGKKSESGRSAP